MALTAVVCFIFFVVFLAWGKGTLAVTFIAVAFIDALVALSMFRLKDRLS